MQQQCLVLATAQLQQRFFAEEEHNPVQKYLTNFPVMLPILAIVAFALCSAPIQAIASNHEFTSQDDNIATLLTELEWTSTPGTLADAEAAWALLQVLKNDYAQTWSFSERFAQERAKPWFEKNHPSWHQRFALQELHARLRYYPQTISELIATGPRFDIPLADHPLVDMYIQYFTGRGRDFFSKWLARADRYLPLMQPILAEKGLPLDLVYVAMVESGFSAHAISSAAACGFWQFIRSTGKSYKLTISAWIDERRDFMRSTEAAAEYLHTLYNQFGDWHLAWAGYNAGAGRVWRTLERKHARDFWDLADVKWGGLAKETRHYVPKVIAAAIVAKNRVQYGFSQIEPLDPLQYEELEVHDSVELRRMATALQLDLETLQELNPALLHDITPPKTTYRLRVPKDTKSLAVAWLDQAPADERLSYVQHKIRRGDTLYGLAARYRSTVPAIRDFNQIRNPRVLGVGKTLIIPRIQQGTGKKHYRPRKSSTKTALLSANKHRNSKNTRAHHVVTKGDTLWSIAQQYGMSVEDLKKRNQLSSNAIRVGTALMLAREIAD